MGVGGVGRRPREQVRGADPGDTGAPLCSRLPGREVGAIRRRRPALRPPPPPRRSLLRAEMSRGEPEPWLPARFDRTLPSFPRLSGPRAFLPGLESGRLSGGAVFLVLGRVFVPAAARPRRTGGRHGRRRPRPWGGGGGAAGPTRERSPALPGGALCPQLRRSPRSAARRRVPRSTCGRDAFVYGGPPSGGALGRRGRGSGRGRKRGEEGPRRGPGRPTSPPDPAAAECERTSASRDSPGKTAGSGPRGRAVSARGARQGRARASGSRDLDTGAGGWGGGAGGRRREGVPGPSRRLRRQLQGGAARVPRGGRMNPRARADPASPQFAGRAESVAGGQRGKKSAP